MTVHLMATRSYPVDPADAFAALLPMPLTVLFRRPLGPIPAVRGTDETGVWGAPGQRRRIDLVGPGSMLETLTSVDPPCSFTYTLSGLTGPLAALLHSAEGRWLVSPVGTGSRITWEWDVHPRPAGRLVMPLFVRLWRGYAARALAELEPYLLSS